MRPNSWSQHGVFRPRVCAALLLCIGSVVLAMFAFAVPTPPSAGTKSAHLSTSIQPAVLGVTSPVTITEFSDFQCPHCNQAASVVEQVRQTYGERVKVIFKQ